MTTTPIQVALITHAGGAHVGAYLTALAASEACGRVLLADPDGRWREPAQRVLKSKLKTTYSDLTTLLQNEQPTLGLVSMEAKLAPPVIDAVLGAGVHVFAEKPACVRTADFAPLVRKADSKHLHLMLALANRTNPEVLAAKKLIDSGKIGRIYGLEMHLIADQTRLTRPGYRKQWFAHKSRAGGGHLIWLGIHWLDLAMYLTGADVEQVAGFTANVGGQPLDIEDSASATFKFSNGTLGTLTSGYYLDKGYHSHIKIWGSQGWLLLEPTGDLPLRWSENKGDLAGKVQKFTAANTPRGYTPFVSAAVKSCAEKTLPPITTADSYRALRTVFAIYESAAGGRVVKVN